MNEIGIEQVYTLSVVLADRLGFERAYNFLKSLIELIDAVR